MLNDDLKQKERIFLCLMIYLGMTLALFYYFSYQHNNSPLPLNPSPTQTISKYADYTSAFGDDSLQEALIGVKFEDINDYDKIAINEVMAKLGGSAQITEESITLTLNNQSVIIYYDGTTTLINDNGDTGGTRWLDTELSKLIKPLEEQELVMCLSTKDNFAVKYKCSDISLYKAYCTAMNNKGWVTKSFSDIMFIGEKDDYILNVLFNEGVFTIIVTPSLKK